MTSENKSGLVVAKLTHDQEDFPQNCTTNIFCTADSFFSPDWRAINLFRYFYAWKAVQYFALLDTTCKPIEHRMGVFVLFQYESSNLQDKGKIFLRKIVYKFTQIFTN